MSRPWPAPGGSVFAGCGLVVSALLLAAPAVAKPEFPGIIQREVGAPCVPSCLICHETDPGVAGNQNKDFVATLLLSGPTPQLDSEENLVAALSALAADASIDTDSDGTGDHAALQAALDPNGLLQNGTCTPGYGCGAHVAPQVARQNYLPFGLVAVLLAVALWVRRRTT